MVQYKREGGHTCVYLCMCGPIWEVSPADLVIHQTGPIHRPLHVHPLIHIPPIPPTRPIGVALCQAWRLHINFSSLAP